MGEKELWHKIGDALQAANEVANKAKRKLSNKENIGFSRAFDAMVKDGARIKSNMTGKVYEVHTDPISTDFICDGEYCNGDAISTYEMLSGWDIVTEDGENE